MDKTKNPRCVVVAGADIENKEKIKGMFCDSDFFIFCDSGLRHENALGIKPDLIVGDFDSHEKPVTDTEIIELPCEKDDTDTVFAVKEAISRGYDDFLIIGAIGARLDHTLGNVSILLMLDSLGKHGVIADNYSVMEIVGKEPKYIDDSYAYFSLLNISGTAKGVTIENAKYPLDNAEITCDYQYGISNEPLKGKQAVVKVEKGKLLLVKIS